MPRWRIDEIAGGTQIRNGWEIRPVARVVRVRWLRRRLEWRQPVAIEIRQGAQARRVAIHDATRRALVWLAVVNALLCVFAFLAGAQRARHDNRRRVYA